MGLVSRDVVMLAKVSRMAAGPSSWYRAQCLAPPSQQYSPNLASCRSVSCRFVSQPPRM